MAQCKSGKPCGSTCIQSRKKCRVGIGDLLSRSVATFAALAEEEAGPPYDPKRYEGWEEHARGAYGIVSFSPDGQRAVKQLIDRGDGKGGFGPHEVELGKAMGELGLSPRVYSHSDKHIEMELVKGKPLWAGYQKAEEEEPMNAAQASQAARAIRSVHKLGFFHGDMHNKQFMVNGDTVKLVDFGLSRPATSDPRKLIQDLNKISSLVAWDNPALDGDPYVRLVRKYREMYRNPPSNRRDEKQRYQEEVGRAYLQELGSMEFTE